MDTNTNPAPDKSNTGAPSDAQPEQAVTNAAVETLDGAGVTTNDTAPAADAVAPVDGTADAEALAAAAVAQAEADGLALAEAAEAEAKALAEAAEALALAEKEAAAKVVAEAEALALAEKEAAAKVVAEAEALALAEAEKAKQAVGSVLDFSRARDVMPSVSFSMPWNGHMISFVAGKLFHKAEPGLLRALHEAKALVEHR
jgi:membrane protein involved in colicin uptake